MNVLNPWVWSHWLEKTVYEHRFAATDPHDTNTPRDRKVKCDHMTLQTVNRGVNDCIWKHFNCLRDGNPHSMSDYQDLHLHS